MNLNHITLIGRLTRDPELKNTANGFVVCTFTLAVERTHTNQQGKKETDFIPIVTWNGLAKTAADYLTQGRLVAVVGRLQIRNYENNEGRKVYVSEVVGDDIKFLDSYKSDQSQNQQPSNIRQSDNQNGGYNPFNHKPLDISDDDLPF